MTIVQTELVSLLNDPEKPLFPDNQLAYLALTGKVEHQFRDALAWRMASWARDRHWLMAREYAKARSGKQGKHGRLCDLAVLREDPGYRPVALIEFKAMTTRNNESNRFLNDLRCDIECWKDVGEVIGVLLAAHVKRVIQEDIFSDDLRSGAVKYMDWVKRAMKVQGELEETRKKCRDRISNNLEKDECLGEGQIDGGTAFGAKVEVLFWAIRPRHIS